MRLGVVDPVPMPVCVPDRVCVLVDVIVEARVTSPVGVPVFDFV